MNDSVPGNRHSARVSADWGQIEGAGNPLLSAHLRSWADKQHLGRYLLPLRFGPKR
jgi:hypothetical protein